MEVKWIEDFVALARHRTFSRTAEVRHVTQSGLSRRIKSLEQWVGVELIDRSAFPPELTPAGAQFLETAQGFLRRLLAARELIRAEHRIGLEGLNVAAGHAIAVGLLPRLIRRIQTHFRAVNFRIIPTNVHDSIAMLLNGSCQLMLAYERAELPLHIDASRFISICAGNDALVPVCAPTATGSPRYALPGSAANPLPLIAYGPGTYFSACLALLLRDVETPPVLSTCFECDMADVLKQLALNGEGVAWLPRSLIETELAEGTLVPAGDKRWTFELELRLYHDSENTSGSLRELWAALATSETQILELADRK
ncbi:MULTISPECIES: LysR substrate-binding domain-containing protein [Pandoraea]|uniref:LysR substrate-binding domain-containing protein n=1 Tax=Pandoraea TaxID=93217 RepID=UPI001F5CB6FB|nr:MULTISPECIES: LysR substrate-binding domain-containing protein [Pandoraea]MCI3208050.1 LysR family transcriptional regulator [Pandoraea sp. LA3]MDN4586079.1 LysR family transcriptional regulator [Pandoraea capi]